MRHLLYCFIIYADIDADTTSVPEDFSTCQTTNEFIGIIIIYYNIHCMHSNYSSYCIATQAEGALVFNRFGLDSKLYTSGIVALYHGRNWGNICGHSTLSMAEADVICHQMTYTGASSMSFNNDQRSVLLPNHIFGHLKF